MRTLAGLVLVLAALAGCSGAPADGPATPAPERTTFASVPSFDGHLVPVTLYRPATAGPSAPVPVVLHVHGWGGARETRLGAFAAWTDAGLGVVSIDMRGHGEARATSQSRVASPAYEVRDVQAVLGHVATLDWVRAEDPGDPVAGIMGESYGGAMALLSAAHDVRLDAVVARDTWNDLLEAMAPGGVPKTAWLASLWLSASAQGRIHPEVRAGFEAAVQRGFVPDGSGGTTDLAALFRANSPAAYPGRITVPTLLAQGTNDTLFDLAQAMRNHALVAASGAEVAFTTHLAGHSLASGRPREGRHPCGDPDELALQWMRSHLDGGASLDWIACVTLDTGATLSGDAFPPAPVSDRTFEVGDLQVRPGNLTSIDAAAAAPAEPGLRVLGTPTLAGSASDGAAGTVYWSLEAVDAQGQARTVNGQVRPMRLLPGPFETELAAIALDLREGESLRLAASAYNPLFAADRAERPPVTLTGLRLTLPVIGYST